VSDTYILYFSAVYLGQGESNTMQPGIRVHDIAARYCGSVTLP